jgi:hypothetical protein
VRKVLLFVLVSASGVVVHMPDAFAACPPPSSAPLLALELPRQVPLTECDIRGRAIIDGYHQLRVPEPGRAVFSDVLIRGGPSDLFGVSTSRDGVVTFPFEGNDIAWGSQSTGDVVIQSSPAACDDEAYNKHGHKEPDLFQWFFNRDTTPTAQITKDEAQGALRAAITNITHSEGCNMADQVNATSSFQGNTNVRANIANGSGACLEQDRDNVADFGDLPAPLYGKACWEVFPIPFADDDLTDGDIRLDKTGTDWTVTPGTGCSNDYDVEGSATHEWGHIFGLAHVAEDTHGNLTMSTHEDSCDASQRSLGRGDILGLRDLY